MQWRLKVTTIIVVASIFGVFSCSRGVSKEEAALRAWQPQAEAADRARMQRLQRKLANDEAELKEELADLRPMPKERRRYAINSAREMVTRDKDAIGQAQRAAQLCSDIIRTDLAIYAHNRDDPNHPEATGSDFRKYLCGGP